jgi:hypothetical protein
MPYAKAMNPPWPHAEKTNDEVNSQVEREHERVERETPLSDTSSFCRILVLTRSPAISDDVVSSFRAVRDDNHCMILRRRTVGASPSRSDHSVHIVLPQ